MTTVGSPALSSGPKATWRVKIVAWSSRDVLPEVLQVIHKLQ